MTSTRSRSLTLSNSATDSSQSRPLAHTWALNTAYIISRCFWIYLENLQPLSFHYLYNKLHSLRNIDEMSISAVSIYYMLHWTTSYVITITITSKYNESHNQTASIKFVHSPAVRVDDGLAHRYWSFEAYLGCPYRIGIRSFNGMPNSSSTSLTRSSKLKPFGIFMTYRPCDVCESRKVDK